MIKKTSTQKKVFFQSSLPRAGSTLLQNIMGQNPMFYVTPTSGVLELLYSSRVSFTNSLEFKAQNKEIMDDGFLSYCKFGMMGFYEGVTEKPYVLDKSRGWGIHYNFVNMFYPNPKIVCMIRDLRDIFSSMEKNYRKNQHRDSGMIDHNNLKGTTTEKRVDIWSNGLPIGLAIERIGQMIKEGISDNILFIKYEDLLSNPNEQMKKIYDFFEIYQFNHNFNDIKQITKEDDSVYGIYGDHKIKNRLEPHNSDYNTILGPELSNNIYNHYKWYYDYFKY